MPAVRAGPVSLRLLRPTQSNATHRTSVPRQEAPGITLQGLLTPEDNAAITAFCFFNFVLDVQACAQVHSHHSCRSLSSARSPLSFRHRSAWLGLIIANKPVSVVRRQKLCICVGSHSGHPLCLHRDGNHRHASRLLDYRSCTVSAPKLQNPRGPFSEATFHLRRRPAACSTAASRSARTRGRARCSPARRRRATARTWCSWSTRRRRRGRAPSASAVRACPCAKASDA